MSETPALPSFDLTPLEVVEALDRHIIGQHKAKRAVAVALRNHLRRRRLDPELQTEVSPKNILMIGATGVGKTEIARRLAKLARAPFIKVEATKFTEVGYVGRDVESIVRDLVAAAVAMVGDERKLGVAADAERFAEARLLDALLPGGSDEGRSAMQKLLSDGKLEDRQVEIDVQESSPTPMMGIPGMEQMQEQLKDAFAQFMPKRSSRRKLSVRDARRLLATEEAEKLIDHDEVHREALWRAENSGIVFLDELDKIASSGHSSGPDVSGEGVQRDLLPIVEGTSVSTRWGQVNTDHVLFIAAGAFSVAKPSDLIPELQGRFPVRVELEDLNANDLRRILTQPEHALTKQYQALLAVDGTELQFSDDGLEAIAQAAERVNREIEDIGARRLHTILETVLEDVAFGTNLGRVQVDAAYVERKIGALIEDEDLSRYVL
jgi:ATP-dependent HslUV protease ATP-binding subunit HslU